MTCITVVFSLNVLQLLEGNIKKRNNHAEESSYDILSGIYRESVEPATQVHIGGRKP
jgi:hypothetical protein